MKEDEVGWKCGTHGEGRVAYRDLVGRPEVKRPLEDLGVGGRIKLKWTLRDRNRWVELDSAGSGLGPAASFCEHGDEPLDSLRRRDIFHKLSNIQLFKYYPLPLSK
jgi:hypothetical protein